jgi:hydantoinase/carbamoylase family amidase
MGRVQSNAGARAAGADPGRFDGRAERLLRRLDELFEIGRAAGTNRPGLAAGEQRAFDLVEGWMRDAELEVVTDRAGNLIARRRGSDPDLPEVWSGSHLDTPPDGGRFDGALGVVAALDAVEAIAAGSTRRSLAAVAFRMEEGCRFGRGVFGSRAICGMLEPDEADLHDAGGISLGEAFAALGLGSLPTRGWLDPPPFAYVEPHIEQGPTLAASGAPLGLVTSIAGMAGIELAFHGSRGHAGTVPMGLRADALGAAARFVERAHELARSLPGSVATIGRLSVSPGATNTIPELAELFADLRAPDAERLDALVSGTLAVARSAASECGCRVEIAPRWRYPPVSMSAAPREALGRAIAGLGVEPVELPSGAGHDAAVMAMAGVPSAMLFVRSDAGGVSHAPEEATGHDAVAACLGVLEPALRELADA